jgi:hypothetical protein
MRVSSEKADWQRDSQFAFFDFLSYGLGSGDGRRWVLY